MKSELLFPYVKCMPSMMKDEEVGTRVVEIRVGKNCMGELTEVKIVGYSY